MNNQFKSIDENVLKHFETLAGKIDGAHNLRLNGKSISRKNQDGITIESKPDFDGININIDSSVDGKSVYIPVIINENNLEETVYNDFYIKDNTKVDIVAGCGIFTNCGKESNHSGVHRFFIGENCFVTYTEKHIGAENDSKKIMNPITEINIGKSSTFKMNTIQLGGVDSTERKTIATLDDSACLIVSEKILTNKNQYARTLFEVNMEGSDCKSEIISRAVARESSKQIFLSNVYGKNKCFGFVECDGILCDNASIESTPSIVASNINAVLTHEAAIGKISDEQIEKLMSIGLEKEEAEKIIIEGFLS